MKDILRSTLALVFFSPVVAFAHDTDCNGKTQATVALSGCCGKEDYLALKPNQVRADGIGWDVFIDGAWREARHGNGGDWIIAQPTLAACWGIWYRRGRKDGGSEMWLSHEGNTEDYSFYCLEQPATD